MVAKIQNDKEGIIIGNELRMKILIIEPNKQPYTEKIWNDLESLRKKIGQEIEVIEYNKVLIVYNARGLADNIPVNRYIDELAIRGTFVITGNNTKELDFESLKEEEIEKYTEMFTLDREEELEL